MIDVSPTDFARLPGLYRLWDLQFVIDRENDHQIHYVELTEDGAPLFMVYRRTSDQMPFPGMAGKA